jgi:hypothetical protein
MYKEEGRRDLGVKKVKKRSVRKKEEKCGGGKKRSIRSKEEERKQDV